MNKLDCVGRVSFYEGMGKPLKFPLVALLLVSLCEHSSIAKSPDFETEIAPILEAMCLSCHNQNDAEGDLILESRSLALEHPDAILPGNASQSYLIEMISGTVPEMPEEGDPLTWDQVKLLSAWIDAGAAWPENRLLAENRPRDLDWWSLKPLVGKRVPEEHGIHPVDAFINSTLHQKN